MTRDGAPRAFELGMAGQTRGKLVLRGAESAVAWKLGKGLLKRMSNPSGLETTVSVNDEARKVVNLGPPPVRRASLVSIVLSTPTCVGRSRPDRTPSTSRRGVRMT